MEVSQLSGKTASVEADLDETVQAVTQTGTDRTWSRERAAA